MTTEKQLVQIGAGKIGRGYIADLFKEAGYQITFIDYSLELVNAMNAQGYYTIFKHHANGTYSKVIIQDYLAYCTQTQEEKCIASIADVPLLIIRK